MSSSRPKRATKQTDKVIDKDEPIKNKKTKTKPTFDTCGICGYSNTKPMYCAVCKQPYHGKCIAKLLDQEHKTRYHLDNEVTFLRGERFDEKQNIEYLALWKHWGNHTDYIQKDNFFNEAMRDECIQEYETWKKMTHEQQLQYDIEHHVMWICKECELLSNMPNRPQPTHDYLKLYEAT
jgi:hypothetical protein